MPPREEQEPEYPTSDPVAAADEGNRAVEEPTEVVSLDGSEAEDAELMKDAPGVDMRAAPREHSGLYVMVFYIIFSFVSFVFMLTSSTTIAWYKASNGDKWTLWKNVDGEKWQSNPCAHKKQIFQAMEAFTISGCVVSLGCVVAGVLQAVGAGHMGASLALASVAMICNLVAWSLGVHQYHKYNCPGEIAYVDKINRLQAGFCLTIVSFAFMLFAVIALGYYFYAYFSFTAAAKEKRSRPAVISALLVGGCLIITCVGNAFTMWEQYSTTHKIKITLWHVEILNQQTGLSEFYSYKNYKCKDLNKMFQAGEAFAIISAAFLFLTLLMVTAAVFSRVCKWIAVGLGIAAWVFLLVCWAIMIGARYRTFCKNGAAEQIVNGLPAVPLNIEEQRVDFTGFVITEGLGMIISAWCAMTVVIVYFAIRA